MWAESVSTSAVWHYPPLFSQEKYVTNTIQIADRFFLFSILRIIILLFILIQQMYLIITGSQ